MKLYKNIVLLSDLDGTLLDSNSKVSKRNQEAIKEFISKGGRFGIATGRSHLNAITFLEDVEINIPCILYNGCGLYDFHEKEFLALSLLHKEKLIEYLQYCLRNFEDVGVQIYSTQMCYVVSQEALADAAVIAEHQPCVFCALEDILEKPWIKILFNGKNEELRSMEKKIKNFGLSDEISWVFSSEVFLEVMPVNTTKGSMLRKLRECIKKGDKIYAVGDYNNDKEMLQAADVGIATENAIHELKEIADRITVSNDESAIAEIIDNLLMV